MIRRTKLTFDAQRWKAEEALAREGVSIMVCAGTGCIASGTLAVYETLHRLCKEKGLPVSVSLSRARRRRRPSQENRLPRLLRDRPACEHLPDERHIYPCQARGLRGNHRKDHKGRQGAIQRLLFEEDGKKYKARDDIPFYLKQQRADLSGNAVSPIARIFGSTSPRAAIPPLKKPFLK